MEEYDLVVIGTGSAGSAAAYRCRQAGWKVAIIDSRPFGGTCALRGCDPKKVLVGAAELVDRSEDMKGRGIESRAAVIWPELMRYKKTFTDPVPGSREKGYAAAGIDTFRGRAKFSGRNSVEVGGETLTGRYIVIAAGAKPMELGIDGEEHVATSDDFLELEELPEDITFIGGGYISFELAHAAAAAGARVRILHRSGKPLKNFDPDLVGMLAESMREKGIDIRLNVPVSSVEKKGGKLVVRAANGAGEFETGLVVHGAGRVPDIDGLDLEKGGVSRDRKGILVNEFLQSVSNPSVYAGGDATATGLPLTPVAGMEGAVIAKNLLGGNTERGDYTTIPSVVFTVPPLAAVGMSEEDAKKGGIDAVVKFQDTSSWYSSRRIALKRSAFKVITERSSGKILGAHILGNSADEVINIFALAIRFGLTAAQLKGVPWAYPTHASDVSYMV